MTRALWFATLILAVALLGACALRAQNEPQQPASAPPPVKTEVPAKPRLTADQAYRANCTRCHSELPKLEARGMSSVLMHMRVRANMPEDEARAILTYLTR